jgi:exosortase/archaeosortase family protein
MNPPLTAITPLLKRVIVFLILFVVVSGATGPRIISSPIMVRDGFALYGGIGKALIFGFITLVLLMRRQAQFRLHPWHKGQLGYTVVAAIAFYWSWISVNGLFGGERSWLNLAGAHGGMLLCLGLLFISCFGWGNMRLLWQKYHQTILLSGAASLGFYVFLQGVYALWRPLAWIVLKSTSWLLALSGLEAVTLPPNTLVFDKFSVTIAEFCSGVESITLFTSLYAIVGLLDWQHFNKKRYFLVFPGALALLFGLNIIRVYGLIMAGYYLDPQLAFSLFHTYAGMVFFILYSALFWAVAYKYLVQKPAKTTA